MGYYIYTFLDLGRLWTGRTVSTPKLSRAIGKRCIDDVAAQDFAFFRLRDGPLRRLRGSCFLGAVFRVGSMMCHVDIVSATFSDPSPEFTCDTHRGHLFSLVSESHCERACVATSSMPGEYFSSSFPSVGGRICPAIGADKSNGRR